MLYLTAIATGMRAGELAGLEWADVNVDSRLIMVQRSFLGLTKSGQARPVPILDMLLGELRGWRLRHPGRLVFTNRDGNMLDKSARAFQEVLHRALDRGGFPSEMKPNGHARPYVTFHGLRHTFASHWMMRGGDIFKLQKILGHQSTTMTDRYAHLAPHAFADDYARFGAGRVLMHRLKVEDGASCTFEALPFESLRQELAPLRGNAEHEALLREVIELGRMPERFYYRASKLFRDLASVDVAATERVLRGVVASRRADDIEYVAQLLACLPSALVGEQLSLVADVLGAAKAAGGRCFERVESSLVHALVPSAWGSVVGKPDPSQVAAMETAKAAAVGLPDDSPERALFEKVVDAISRSIKRHVEQDEEWLES
jgi:hypothetical protein